MYASTQYHQDHCATQAVAALDFVSQPLNMNYNTNFQNAVYPGVQMEIPQQVFLSGAPPLHAPIPLPGQTPSLLEYGALQNVADHPLPSSRGYHSNRFMIAQNQVQYQQQQQHQAPLTHKFSGPTAASSYDGSAVDAPIDAHLASSDLTPTHSAHEHAHQAAAAPPQSLSASSSSMFSYGPPDHNDFPIMSQPFYASQQQQIDGEPVPQAHSHYTSGGALHPQAKRYPEVVAPMDLPDAHFVQPEQQQAYNHDQPMQHQTSAVRHQHQSSPPAPQHHPATSAVRYAQAPVHFPSQYLQHHQYQPQAPVHHNTSPRAPPYHVAAHNHDQHHQHQHQNYQRQQGAASHPYRRLPGSILTRNNDGAASTGVGHSGLHAAPINPPPPPIVAEYQYEHRQHHVRRGSSDMQVVGAPQAVYDYPSHSLPPPLAQQHLHQNQHQYQQHQQQPLQHQPLSQRPQPQHQSPQSYDPPPPYIPDETMHPHPNPQELEGAPPSNRFLTPSELLIEMADKGLAGAGGTMSGSDSGNLSAESSFNGIGSGDNGGGMGGGSLSGGGGMGGGTLRGGSTGGLAGLGDMFTIGESASKARRKAMAKRIGFMPTDPDGISSHEKKRYYLECLEEYTLYLHKQIELMPPNRRIEPVPLERVRTYPGLSCRSIRTLLVHMERICRSFNEDTIREEQRFLKLREAFFKRFGVYGKMHA